MRKTEYRWVKKFATRDWEPAKFVWDEHNNLVGLATFNTHYIDPKKGLNSFFDFKLVPMDLPVEQEVKQSDWMDGHIQNVTVVK